MRGNGNPIGVFDSGMGGLTVWNEIRRALPEESLLYYADGINCPYGPRPRQEICRFTAEAVGWLAERGAKLVVLACNTATAAAVEYLRANNTFPIVGMEPAVKPAALSTVTGTVAILATETSLKGELYNRTASAYGKGINLIPAVGEGFVELVERGKENTPEAREAVRRVVEPLIEAGADRIVLGCTHYSFLADAINDIIADRNVLLVDSAPAIERRVSFLLDEYGLRAGPGNSPFYEFYSPAGTEYLESIKSRASLLTGPGIVL